MSNGNFDKRPIFAQNHAWLCKGSPGNAMGGKFVFQNNQQTIGEPKTAITTTILMESRNRSVWEGSTILHVKFNLLSGARRAF